MLIVLAWFAGISWYVIILFMMFLMHGKQIELEAKINYIVNAVDSDNTLIRIIKEQDASGEHVN